MDFVEEENGNNELKEEVKKVIALPLKKGKKGVEEDREPPLVRFTNFVTSSIIRANDKSKLYWDAIIILIAILNTIFIPMTIAFTGLNDKLNKSTLYVVFNIAGTVFFIIDIFINLNTSYYDHDGDEI